MASNDLRHAVTDGPTGTAGVVAPPAHDAAARLRAEHRMFWCTTQAGGCGGVLDLHVGKVRIPHFQHRRDASACALTTRDAGPSYAHLAYQRELAAWLAGQGYEATIEHRFDDAGRADLHVLVEGVAHTLEVQLTDIGAHTWKDRDARYRAQVDRVTWLHGPASRTTATTERVERDYALRIGRDADSGVRVGVDTIGDDGATVWAPLRECRITPAGVWTPHLETALRELAETRAEEARRRAAEEAERARRAAQEAARRADLEREQQEARARRAASQAQRAPATAAAHVVPSPGMRTTADWRRLHPDLPLWGPDHPGWAWLREYPVEHHEAGMYLAITVVRLYSRGGYSMLANPDLPAEVAQAMVEDMTAAGWLQEDTRGAREAMWVRGERAPVGF
ncbi:competence protein CoiA family protein [Cellulomonas sp.]|uniref:competence protein CoiA family protein n=1 Tax=Cellulomonas sp. TaxID=40001 RepID=UPI00281172B3|nr:competence protein CoiA family protein [Cellulomonas sp.]